MPLLAGNKLRALRDDLKLIGAVAAPVGAPLTIAYAGSSSPDQYLSAFTGGTQSNYVTVSSDGLTWSKLITGRFGMEAGNLNFNATSRPVRYIAGGVSGSTLAQWEGNTNNFRTNLTSAIVAAGGADAVLIQVGYNDLPNGTVTSAQGQATLIRSLISKIRTEVGKATLQVFIGLTQDSDSYNGQLSLQRQAEMTVINNDANVRIGMVTGDQPTSDGTHQTEAGQAVTGSRFAAQVLAYLNGTTQVRGPYVVSAAQQSQTSTIVTIAHRAGTDFTPASALAGFQMATSGGTALAVSAASRQSATKITLTHASTGSTASTLIYMANGASADDSSQLHDNSTLALPMEPGAAAISIPRYGI